MKKQLLALLLALSMLLSGCGYVVVDDQEPEVLSGILGGAALGEGVQAASPEEIQTRLIQLGFLTGQADGIFGPRSAAALSAFQEYCGLTPSGEADEATLSLLFGDPAALPTPAPTPVAVGARDTEQTATVRDLQQRLIDLNYLSTQADGIFGPGTDQAL